jgi:hypothetical protein
VRFTTLFLLRHAWYFLTKMKALFEEGGAALNRIHVRFKHLNAARVNLFGAAGTLKALQ